MTPDAPRRDPVDLTTRAEAAAKRLEELAAMATPGPWTVDTVNQHYPDGDPDKYWTVEGPVDLMNPICEIECIHEPDARLIAALGPDMARVLAAHIRAVAQRHTNVWVLGRCKCGEKWPCPDLLSLVPVIDAVLGSDQ